MSKIRIKDIAAAAGVSVGTVDRVLHGRGRVAKEAESKVREAIKKLNYQPNLAARSLARNRNHKVAIVLPDQRDDEFWMDQRKGVLRGLMSTKDFGLTGDIFSFNDQKQGDLLKLSDDIFERNYEALLIAPTVMADAEIILNKCDERDIPYVQINSFLDRTDSHSLGYVGQDSFRSGQLAGKLIDISTLPHGSVAVLHMESDVENRNHMIAKEAGFLKYFEEHGGYEVVIKNIVGIDDEAQLTDQISTLLTQAAPVRGLFVTTSRIHYIAHVMHRLGIEDITLVGFDIIEKNIEALSNYKKLFLINQNPALQGYYGVMRLFDFILRNKTVADTKYLPLDIITLENVSNYLHMQDRDNIDDVHM